LLNAQANINAKINNKYTPLHAAIIHNHPEIVEILLKNNADINTQLADINNEALLFLADYHQNPVIIDLLHKYGAPKISDEQAQKDEQEFFEQSNQKESQSTPPTQQSSPVIRTNDENISTKSISTKQTPIKAPTTTKTTSSPVISQNEYHILQDKHFKWPKFLTRTQQYAIKNKLKTQQYAIKNKLKELKHWPETSDLDIKPLQEEEKGTYRLRVGNCRVVFYVDKQQHQILIKKIGPRKNIYKKIKLI
jgi:mRNA-degrading endonuclease RelE of RelBE toxin-antitoxin system